MEKNAAVLIGTGGWDHESLDPVFYPEPGLTSIQRLRHYARFFDTVEVRQAFWDDSLSSNDAWEWLGAVADNRRFLFNVKLHCSFTHRKEIKPAVTRNVRAMLQELLKADRLGSLLVQFPYAFTNTSSHRYHAIRLSEVFEGFPVHVEFRHESWNFPGLQGFLEEHNLHPVNADLPRIKQFMPFMTASLGDTAYIRLHGRNEQGWLKNEMDTRYDYLYNAKEIRELTRRVEILAAKDKRITIICNNTTHGKAVANALQLISSTGNGRSLAVSRKTIDAFPMLTTIASPINEEELLLDEEIYRRVV